MPYTINHVHIRSADPSSSAEWYAEHFGARKLFEREVMPGTITIGYGRRRRPRTAQHLLPSPGLAGRQGRGRA